MRIFNSKPAASEQQSGSGSESDYKMKEHLHRHFEAVQRLVPHAIAAHEEVAQAVNLEEIRARRAQVTGTAGAAGVSGAHREAQVADLSVERALREVDLAREAA